MNAPISETTDLNSLKKYNAALLCLIGMLIIGDIDYITGYKISVVVVYILPIGWAAIGVGPAFAVLLAVLSMSISIGSDLWAGLPYSELPTQLLNASIALTVFFISIALLQVLKRRQLQRE